MESLIEKQIKEQKVWNRCADKYSNRIISGYSEISLLQDFEEDFLDYILMYIINKKHKPISLLDLGCGSGRI